MSQIAEFHAAILQSLPELTPAEMQEWIGPSRSTLRSGLSFLKLRQGQSVNDFIHIDRSIRPVYPGWIRKLIHPELEATGPQEYQLDSLELSLHPKQEADGVTTGHKVFEHQQKLGLEGCLGLADLLAIQALGIEAFRRHFRDKAVFGWKSVVQDRSGRLVAPYLFENGGRVILNWFWLDRDWNADRPALRFAK